MMKIIDLSQTITNDMPVYPGDVIPSVEIFRELKKDGANIVRITLGTHTGSHVDVPYHFSNTGVPVNKIPLDCFVGDAWFFDVSHKAADMGITNENLADKEYVKEGEMVIFYTGCSKARHNVDWLHHYVHLSNSGAD